ncbi:exonuclease domain-containing protein [Paracoccus sp. 1_MG-2023]|uniref:3'-5' exonuclease n=1 Tax=unclassified Paracoccus (in: a-proteobacteria) TaxID=2688777 RepID=UPI001C081FEA|nr:MULTISPECIES: 3'-5' exonuclease [unclassified Paracoccus (in: a-proteobacteria)]MBU2958657.1 3'-5' exonuclease [Paracoccus sp. C2R09]MDO6667650.1 exonuclease domain-containing protein [Paracoccus sp. 1_MG-2023]
MLRRRLLAVFAGLLVISAGLIAAALFIVARMPGPDGIAQAAAVLGFGFAGGLIGAWYLLDGHVARPIQSIAGALRTGRVPTGAPSSWLTDLGQAATDAARARATTERALSDALDDHAAEIQREKAALEEILADFGAGAVMVDGRGRVVFYNASAARLMPGLGLDQPLDRHLQHAGLTAAEGRLKAGGSATDMSCLTHGGLRLSGRIRQMDHGRLLILRDAARRPATRDQMELLRRHASTLVPMLDALDGPIPPALAGAIRAEGQGLAKALRALAAPDDVTLNTARPSELLAGIPAPDLPGLRLRADADAMNALLLSLWGRLPEAQAQLTALTADEAQITLEWQGDPVPMDRLEAWLAECPDPGQPDLTGAEILARHATGIWPEGDCNVARLVMPLAIAPDIGSDHGVTYDFALARRGAASDRLGDLTCVVFDTETTGLGTEDSIVQIAGLRIARGRLTGERFETLVDPGRPIPPGSTRIHGITDAMVAGAPDLAAALAAFRHFCDDAVLVAHNAPFDMGFLRRAQPLTGTRFDNVVLDTVAMSAMIWGASADHSLDALSDRLGIVIPPQDRHTAMGDSIATARAFLQLTRALQGKGITRLDELLTEARGLRRLVADANRP